MTVTENNQIVTISWKPAESSRQESFLIRYRPTLRDPSASWLEQTAVTLASQFSQAFPGERYEISVLAISKGQRSDPSNATVVVGKWCWSHCGSFIFVSCLDALGFLSSVYYFYHMVSFHLCIFVNTCLLCLAVIT